MGVWKNLGAELAKNAEVDKWKGMSPALAVCGNKPNEVVYQNHWSYIVKQRVIGKYEGVLCGRSENRIIKGGCHLVSLNVKFRADV